LRTTRGRLDKQPTNQPKSVVVAAAGGGDDDDAAARGAAVDGVEVERPAPHATKRAGRWATFIGRGFRTVLRVLLGVPPAVEPVVAPLPDVAVHVVNIPSIRLLEANGVGLVL